MMLRSLMSIRQGVYAQEPTPRILPPGFYFQDTESMPRTPSIRPGARLRPGSYAQDTESTPEILSSESFARSLRQGACAQEQTSKSLRPGSKKTPGVGCPYYCNIFETGYQFYREFPSFIGISIFNAVLLPLGGGDFVPNFWVSFIILVIKP